ncbi:MAG: hypothetical protein AAB719_00885 [Patescibacteria group bacterium]
MPKITPRQFDTYLSMIEKSVGTEMFQNLYINSDGEKLDATDNGRLSCAFYASSILVICKYIKEIHATVSSTVRDLKESGWSEISEPIVGSVIVWKPSNETDGHPHLGFYIGNNLAISNDSIKKVPIKHDWKYDGKREGDMILWNPKIAEIVNGNN